MTFRKNSLYADFKRIWTFGMTYSSLDGQFRRGLVKYRGHSKKWLFRDTPSIDYIEEVFAKGDGCDAFLGRLFTKEQADRLAALGQPIYDIGCKVQHPAIRETHQLDHYAGGVMAARFFRSLGHRNFAFFSHNEHRDFCARQSWEGFQEEALKANGSVELLMWDSGKCRSYNARTNEIRYQKLSEWMREIERPMAMALIEGRSGQDVCQFATFSGVSIPEDLALLGFQNDPIICECVRPALTSLDYPAEYWGFRVAESIDADFRGEPVGEIEQIAPTGVVTRNSTALEVIEDEVVARGLARMRQHAHQRVSIAELLADLPVTVRTFQSRFRKTIGRSPVEELFRLRVELARQQLIDTSYTVERVAEECGFRDAESMASYFKRWTDLTPTQFRRKHQASNT